LDRLKGAIDFGAPWQATLFIGGVRGRLEGDPATHAAQRQHAIELVRACAEYAAPRGVPIAIEPINRYETNLINTVAEALEFIDQVGAENLVVLADSFHMNIEEQSLAGALRLAGSKLGYVHFADSNRRAAGQGHIDFHALADVLRQMGYHGYISAEILPLPNSRAAAELAIACFRSL
jgi:sugar phosphate isomerase/epimerase